MMLRIVMVGRSLIFRTIARFGSAFLYYIMIYGLQIVRPADPGEEIDKGSGQVGAIVAQLSGLIIPRENMMVIVPTFTEGADADAVTVGGADGAMKKNKKIKK